MQTIGDEENIKTLFLELRLTEQRVAPRFHAAWNRAQASARPSRVFKLSFVVAAALVIVSLFSLALWLRGRLRSQQQIVAVIPSKSPSVSPARQALEAAPNQIAPLRARYRANAAQRVMRLAEHPRIKMLTLREAEIRSAGVVSTWQSPTAMLMQSPADDVLTSLPQLYRSVNEVNSFLSETQK